MSSYFLTDTLRLFDWVRTKCFGKPPKKSKLRRRIEPFLAHHTPRTFYTLQQYYAQDPHGEIMDRLDRIEDHLKKDKQCQR